jgi:DNA-binding response OmpR family regulator
LCYIGYAERWQKDVSLAEFVKEQLENEHFSVDLAGNTAELMSLLQTRQYDLAILDLETGSQPGPESHSVELVRKVRSFRPDLLILVLSHLADPDTHFNCLDAGADDFVTKPFYSSVLRARFRALLRRRNNPSTAILKVEDLELDRIRHIVRRNGCAIDLTQKEFALLEFLMERPMQAVSRAIIAKDAWNLQEEDTATNTVDVYINYVRKKLESYGDRPLIRTIRGVGYQIGGAGNVTQEQVVSGN